MRLDIRYFADTDTLSLWNGEPASKGGDLIATGALMVDGGMGDGVTGDIIADYDSIGRVVGFTIEHASELLLHPLTRKARASDHLEVEGMYAGYSYTLSMNSGTLTLSSDREKVRSSEVAEHLIAHYDADGDASGFTLDRASELLLPHLNGKVASQRMPDPVLSATNNDQSIAFGRTTMTTPDYSPGLEGVIATETSVSYLDVDIEQILVRGYDLIELAQNLCYTDVAYLVIYGDLPTPAQAKAFCDRLVAEAEVPDELYRLFELMPKSTVAMDALRTGLSFLAGYEDPDLLHDNSHEANLEKGIKLLAQTPTLVVNSYRALNDMPIVRPDPNLPYMENFLYMLRGERPDAESLDAFDRIHMCYIEHEMPNSTFAARVIASTLSDMYGAMVGAVASLKGPLHGGANEAAIEFLMDINGTGGPGHAENYTMGKLERRERIMGFGHRVYMRKYDPRARFLMDYIPKLASRIPEGESLASIYSTVEQVMYREKGLYPNTDYPIGLLYYLLGIPVPLYTPIFLASRTAGNVAHVLEQHDDNRLFRPRVIYGGGRGLTPPATPISPL